MDLKKSELDNKFQKYKGRVVLRDAVNDVSGSYAVFRSKVNLEEPTQITDQVFLGCTQRESETKKKVTE